MTCCILVNPSYPPDRKRRYGVGPDPLAAVLVPAGLRQMAWAIAATTLFGIFVLGASLPADTEPLPFIIALPATLLVFAGLFAPKLVKDIILQEQRSAWRRLDAPTDLAQLLETMRTDAVRFQATVNSYPTTHGLPYHELVHSLAWLLWHTANRVDQIARLQSEIDSAGLHSTGAAKTAWFGHIEKQIAELRLPIYTAECRIRSLANLAEDTVWAARLATESQPTIELATSTAREIGALDDMDGAVDVLSSWYAAWTDLDERLRIMSAEIGKPETSC